MTNAERNVGTGENKASTGPGADGLRLKLRLPPPHSAAISRVVAWSEHVFLPELTIEAQDAESITVIIPASQLNRGSYAIQLTEINNGRETPLRGAYEFDIQLITSPPDVAHVVRQNPQPIPSNKSANKIAPTTF